jgi:hypothetical protein
MWAGPKGLARMSHFTAFDLTQAAAVGFLPTCRLLGRVVAFWGRGMRLAISDYGAS